MAMFPTPWVALHHPYIAGATDAHGNETEAWEVAAVSVPVYGWATPGSDTEINVRRTLVERDLDLYSPTNPFGPKDRVMLGGQMFEVVGYAEDYNHGPFGFTPGYRINLNRAVDLG